MNVFYLNKTKPWTNFGHMYALDKVTSGQLYCKETNIQTRSPPGRKQISYIQVSSQIFSIFLGGGGGGGGHKNPPLWDSKELEGRGDKKVWLCTFVCKPHSKAPPSLHPPQIQPIQDGHNHIPDWSPRLVQKTSTNFWMSILASQCSS